MQDQEYQIFEAFLSGDLNPAQLKAHHKRLEEDQDYKESFELYESLNQHLKDEFKNEKELAQFKNSVSSISKNYFKSREKPKFAWVKMAIAASIIVAIGLYFILSEVSKPQYQEIAQIPTIHLSERGVNTEIYLQAETAFNQEQYEKAIQLFDQILKEENQRHSISLYQAIAYMEMGQTGEARKIYEEIIRKENAFSEEALWYAALNELQEENYKACEVYLKKIKPSASRYKDAIDLLNRL